MSRRIQENTDTVLHDDRENREAAQRGEQLRRIQTRHAPLPAHRFYRTAEELRRQRARDQAYDRLARGYLWSIGIAFVAGVLVGRFLL